MEQTIGLIGMSSLLIFGRPYIRGADGCIGVLKIKGETMLLLDLEQPRFKICEDFSSRVSFNFDVVRRVE